jgi:tripartite-type tricarboxylate transporter receptor subunit TctC
MKRLCALTIAALGLVTTGATAQESWPDKPIRLLVSVAAGGGIDLMARLLAEGMSRELSQRVIVENQGGAGGLLATRTVLKADPNGYTFLFTGPGHASLPYIHQNPGYDVKKDFASVSLVTRFPLVLVTSPKHNVKTVGEFIKMVKASPGKFSFGSSG